MYKRKRPLCGRSLVLYLIGTEPIVKRFRAQIQFGYKFTLFWSAILNSFRYLRWSWDGEAVHSEKG